MGLRSESLRRWSARAMVLVAALACIATSPLRWNVAAPATTVTGTPGKGYVVVVDASIEPRVMIKAAAGNERAASRRGVASASWSGSDDYFVPPGWSLTSVDIHGTCGGFCSSKCVPPPGAFVRVSRVDVVDAWTVEDTFTVPVTFAAGSSVAQLAVQVDASGGLDVSAAPAPGATPPAGMGTPSIYETTAAAATTRTFTVNLYGPIMPAATTIDYVITATMHGICHAGAASGAASDAGAGVAVPCAPPAATRVKVVDAKPL